MATLTLRTVVARPLTNEEVDGNFTSLNLESGNTLANVGILANLSTASKANLVSAINEVWRVNANVGFLSQLSTTRKSNLVSALNEVANEVGDLEALGTPVSSDLVSALNDVYIRATSNVSITGGADITGMRNITVSGNISAAANVQGNYFLGNGSLLTGISVDSTRIANGTSSVLALFNSNIIASVGGSRVMTIDKTTGDVANITVTGNVTANVVRTTGLQDSTGRTLRILDESNVVIWGN